MQTYHPDQGNANNQNPNNQYQQYNGQYNNQYQQYDGQYNNQYQQQYNGQYNNQYQQQYNGQYNDQYQQQYNGQYNNQYQQPYGNPYGMNYQNSYDQGYAGMNGMGINSPMTAAEESLRETLGREVVSKSFLFMLVALLITAVAAVTTSPRIMLQMMLKGDSYWIFVIGELAVVFISDWAIRTYKPILGGVMFAIYSYLNGMVFSLLFVQFETVSIAVVCLVTAGLFGIMAVIGLTTKKDLSNAGSILTMAFLGISLMILVNLVLFQSSMVDQMLCCFVVLIFVGLTAYDAQRIKRRAIESDDSNVLSLAMMGAFQLYLDFIWIFLKLLRLMAKASKN